MIRALIRHILAARRLERARIARLKAYDAVRAAQDRNDDRDLGRALMELRQATLNTLRAEVGS